MLPRPHNNKVGLNARVNENYMKIFLMFLVMTLSCVALLSTTAEAKRFGGGSSFGKSRATPAQQYNRPANAAPAPAPVPVSTGNKWMGPLAGLAVGAGLATMFAGGGMGGMGGGMSSILVALMLAGVVMFLIAKFKKPQQVTGPNMQYTSGGTAYNAQDAMQQTAPQPNYGNAYGSATASSYSGNIPQDFPVDSFLRNAKMSFIRLQAANDSKDLNDVREYTTPEVFAEISMQMQERGNAIQKTEVIVINAELLEVANDGDYIIASVRFTGQLSENKNTPENVDEIWHIQKNRQDENSAWLLTGIQQTNFQ